MREIIQIAGVIDQSEASLLVDAGVEYLGFPLRLKDGREDLSEAAAGQISASLPDGARAVCITYLDSADQIIELCRTVAMNWVQLHGPISAKEVARLKEKAPQLSIIKSLIVRQNNNEQLLQEIELFSPYVDAFITDSYDPQSGRSGATGLTHDWRCSRALVQASKKPLILAGGLTADNVFEAVLAVRPAGVDAHTGLEGSGGRKSSELVRKFVERAREAFALLKQSQ